MINPGLKNAHVNYKPCMQDTTDSHEPIPGDFIIKTFSTRTIIQEPDRSDEREYSTTVFSWWQQR